MKRLRKTVMLIGLAKVGQKELHAGTVLYSG